MAAGSDANRIPLGVIVEKDTLQHRHCRVCGGRRQGKPLLRNRAEACFTPLFVKPLISQNMFRGSGEVFSEGF